MLVLKKIPNYQNKVTINYSSKLYSNAINSTRPVFIPNSTHQTTTALGTPSYYLIEFTDQVTSVVKDTLLVLDEASTNTRYLTFNLVIGLNVSQSVTRTGIIDIAEGKHNYKVYAVLENTTYPATGNGNSEINARFLVDKGVALVYDEYDFTNTYFNPDRQTIPSVISYSNE